MESNKPSKSSSPPTTSEGSSVKGDRNPSRSQNGKVEITEPEFSSQQDAIADHGQENEKQTCVKSFDNTEISFRDAASVAMSECTKPDPPSVIDNQILDAIEKENDDDDDDNDGYASNNENSRKPRSSRRPKKDFEVVISAMQNDSDSEFVLHEDEDHNSLRDEGAENVEHNANNDVDEKEIVESNYFAHQQKYEDDYSEKSKTKSGTEKASADNTNSLNQGEADSVSIATTLDSGSVAPLEPQAKASESGKVKDKVASIQASLKSIPASSRTGLEPKADRISMVTKEQIEDSSASVKTQLEPKAKHSDALEEQKRISEKKRIEEKEQVTEESKAASKTQHSTAPHSEASDPIKTSQQTKNDIDVESVKHEEEAASVYSVPPEHSRIGRIDGPDNLIVLPSVDDFRMPIPNAQRHTSFEHERHYLHLGQHQNSFGYVPGASVTMSRTTMSSNPLATAPMMALMNPTGSPHPGMMNNTNVPAPAASAPSASNGGRRKITLRLEEDVPNPQPKSQKSKYKNGFLGHIRRKSSRMFGSRSISEFQDLDEVDETERDEGPRYSIVNRGKIAVSWFDGTSSLELQEHVRRCVVRKLVRSQGVSSDIELEDLRILDETIEPPEEIVLTPHIPDGSKFLCRFSIRDPSKDYDGTLTPMSDYSVVRPPISPSAAPSPHPDGDILGLNANQLALINNRLRTPLLHSARKQYQSRRKEKALNQLQSPGENAQVEGDRKEVETESENKSILKKTDDGDKEAQTGDVGKEEGNEHEESGSKGSEDSEDDMMLHSEDPIEARFREIFHMLSTERKKRNSSVKDRVRKEKRHVIFAVSNYFVLFLAFIAISAEIQARLPDWLKAMEQQMQSVHNCGANQEALFECVSRGDFAGLLASIGLWLSRSVVTRRVFLFGFETPKKLWTVVYECLVSSVCWGISYLFIRRGLNPDTRPRFVQKYWKDAVYGSLAGFNAAFLKMVLKNLIPQEVVEDALRERQLKILSWLPSFA